MQEGVDLTPREGERGRGCRKGQNKADMVTRKTGKVEEEGGGIHQGCQTLMTTSYET